MRKKQIVAIPKPPEPEAPMGLLPRVRARLRPLHPWERPRGANLDDGRMLEFSTVRKGMTVQDVAEFYDPSLSPELLGDFVRLFAAEKPAPEDKVVEFYRRYGPLGEHVVVDEERRPAWTERLEPADRARLSSEASWKLREPLWWVRERARELQSTYQLYLDLRENRLAGLRALLRGVPEGKRILGVDLVAGQVIWTVTDDDRRSGRKVGSFRAERFPVSEGAWASPLPERECRFWAAQLLAQRLNLGETRSKRYWDHYVQLGEPAIASQQQQFGEPTVRTVGLVRARSCEDLLAAMYLQLGELVERNVTLRQCRGCGGLFHRRHGRQNYCSKSCGDAARQREYYREAKEKRVPKAGRPEQK